MEVLKNQKCPICKKSTLTLTQEEKEIPYFGKVLLFSLHCSNCNYKVSDVEAVEVKEPAKYTLEINSKKDLNIRVVKSSTATVKIPTLKMNVRPGPASDGYITNVEGILNRFEAIIKDQKEFAEDEETRKKAKNLLKKIWKIKCGELHAKLIIEDPTGNSAIISNKAKIEKLKIK